MNLFVFYDQSDYDMMKSVIRENYFICIKGLKQGIVMKENNQLTMEQIGVDKILSINCYTELSNYHLDKLARGLKQFIQIKNIMQVICSTQSIIQGQILQASNNIGVETIAFWNLFTYKRHQILNLGCQIQHLAKTVWFPTQYSYDIMPIKPQGHLLIVGLPQIQQFQEEINSEYCYEFLQHLAQYGQFQHIITYCCLDDPDWMRGLLFFRECLKVYNTNDMLILITTDCELDTSQLKELFKEYKNVILQNKYFNVNKAIRISDLVLMHKSDSSYKIATVRKILFIVDDKEYSNPLIESNRYLLVNNAQNYERNLNMMLSDRRQMPNIYGILGMPSNSVELITKLLN